MKREASHFTVQLHISSSESLLQFHIKDEVSVLELRTNEFNMVTYGIKFFNNNDQS